MKRLSHIMLLTVCLLLSIAAGRALKRPASESLGVTGTITSQNDLSRSVSAGSDHPSALTRAELLYGEYCAKCHGEQGHGDSDGIPPLAIRPRDFRTTQWRFEKTTESAERVIRDGIPGTPMPAAGSALSPEDVAALAEHVMLLGQASGQPSSKSDQRLIAAGFTPVVPARVPSVELVSEDGNVIQLNALVDRPTLVHFWGTSCHHCVAGMSDLDHLSEQLTIAGVSVISICTDEVDADALQSFVRDYPCLNLFVDSTGLTMNRFSATVLPAYFAVDSQGWIVGVANELVKHPTVEKLPAALRPH